MPIRRNLEDMPTVAPSDLSILPSKNPFVVTALAEAWYADWQAQGMLEYKSAIPELPYRASNAAMRCDRQQWYALTDTPRSEEDDIAGIWRMALGTMVHEALERVMDSLSDGWRHEVNVDLRPVGVAGSAHADLVRFCCRVHELPMIVVDEKIYRDDDGEPILDRRGRIQHERVYSCSPTPIDDDCVTGWLAPGGYEPEVEQADITVELKTMNGFGFKMSATNFKGPAEGPKSGHVLQGAMAADALNCDKLVVGYLALENLGVDLAKQYSTTPVGRFAAEWHMSVEAMRPVLDAEYARIQRLMRNVDHTILPSRELHDRAVPSGAVITNPNTGTWQTFIDGKVAEMGRIWFCDYCGWKSHCIDDGAESVEVTVRTRG